MLIKEHYRIIKAIATGQLYQTFLAVNDIVGSPEYTSPEQTQGQAVFASDLYSLGLTCIYLLTQISPFEFYRMSDLFADEVANLTVINWWRSLSLNP